MPLRGLVARLGEREGRHAAAQELASRIGAQCVLLFVRDPALEVLLPAPGMPKTVAGGQAWRQFLRRCLTESWPVAPVDLAGLEGGTAAAMAGRHGALVLVSCGPPVDPPQELLDSLPLLMALLSAQYAADVMNAEAREARASASRASALARALDGARSAAADLNEKLRAEHERKDEFLAMLAHELRNPLAPLVNAVEVMRRLDPGDADSYQRQLDLMHRQLRQMTRLVDDLLDVSRVNRGLVQLKRQSLRLGAVIADAVESARPAIDARGHTLTLSGLEQETYVHGDAARLTQVFSNLLHNAAKYTDPGGQLQLAMVKDVGRASVVIRDNGIGIPQDMLGRVFDVFTQVPRPLDRTEGGLGIGLTLVRDLVQRHGGAVSAYSAGLGRGSTFIVSLPMIASPAPDPHARMDANGQSRLVHGLRVLVVDDNRDAAESLGEMLRLLGAQVEVAHDGVQAIASGEHAPPQVVFLDIGLPGLDGYQVAREWRRRFGTGTRLVALTGYGSEEDRQRAAEAGFDRHCVKPLPAEVLIELLSQAQQELVAPPSA